MLDFFPVEEEELIFGDSATNDSAAAVSESVILHNDGEETEEMQAESLIENENFLIAPIDDLQPVTILVALIVVILIFQTIVRAFKGNS